MNPDSTQDRQSFALIMVTLGELYDKAVSEQKIEIYFDALSAYDVDMINRAANTWIKLPGKGQFMPKPSDLIEIIDGDSEIRAQDAWIKVEKAIRSHGSWDTVIFDDPIIHAVITSLGGWMSLAGTETERDLHFKRLEFLKSYPKYVGRELPAQTPLLGRQAANNAHKFPDQVPAPVVIGDASKIPAIEHKPATPGSVKTLANDKTIRGPL